MDKLPNNISEFEHDDAKILAEELLYDGFFKLKRFTLKHRLYQGGWTPSFQREMLDRGHAAAILLYDPKLDQVVLVEQFRIGALDTGVSPWILEIVAGMIDKPESAQQVAIREAEEEAGVEVKRVLACNSFLPGAGGLSERIYLFVGEVDASQAQGVHGLAEETEDIKVKVFSRQQAFSYVQQGVIDNAAAVISIQWLELNLSKVRQQWLSESV